MKSKILLASGVTLLSLSPFAHASGPNDPAGVWKLVARTCSDSTEPTDRFKLGRDTLELDIPTDNPGRVVVRAVIEQKVHFDEGMIVRQPADDRDGSIYFGSPGNSEEVPYQVFGGWKMWIRTSHFGEGGSCKPGETLSSLFQRSSSRK